MQVIATDFILRFYLTYFHFSGHNHGTLWVDTKKMETLYKHEDGRWTNFDNVLGNSADKLQTFNIIEKALQNYFKDGYVTSSELQKIAEIYHKYLQDENDKETLEENPDDFMQNFVSHFPLFRLTEAFKKF